VVLLRQSVLGLRSLLESDSAVEQMMSKMLATTGRRPSDGEQRSWRASLPVLVNDLVDAGLSNVEVLVEYQLPLTSKRADVVLAGVHPRTGEPTYVVVELKQWSDAQSFEGDPKLVHVPAYGSHPALHPLEQVSGYRQYMLDFLPALQNREDAIQGIAYLHNATRMGAEDLFELGQSERLRLFTGDRRADLHNYLRSVLSAEVSGVNAADQLMSFAVAPSRQLLAVAADEVQNREQFVLLAEQKLAYELVLHEVEKARRGDHKCVVVVSGGPGSGKSVIALSLMGELARQGRSVLHATGSRSFTQTLRTVAGRGSTRVKAMFKYFNQFMEAEPNSLDVLILDEAHRLRETSVNRYTKAHLRQGRPQIDELIAAARVPVFLLDQYQVVRPGEMGSVEEITAWAANLGFEVRTIQLDDQFRCGGSEAFIHWVERLLGLEAGGPIAWAGDDHFVLETVTSLEIMSRRLESVRDQGFGARITAGYCWQWSDPRADGSLVDDVVVGDWSRPWNLKGERAVGGAPPSALWATDPAGFGQVGCVYTAQGFEYDWNGVILGPDLVWRSDRWVTVRGANRDPDFRSLKAVPDEEFDALVRNVYKVLLTRGMLGTLIYSVDDETQEFLESLIHGSSESRH